jgi:hypothetical protein
MVSFQYSLKVITSSRAKLSALSIANDRFEYFRSLPYDSVGVVSGFPAGTIPQNSTTTLNGIAFAENVQVRYVDDPADGFGAADGNGIEDDYKLVRLSYTWEVGGIPGSIVMTGYIVPRAIETNSGGGTVRINVLGADSQLLPGARVRLFNPSNGYDVTYTTDTNGAALFSVLADSNYQVTVSGPIAGQEYSVDGTHEATVVMPNPIVAPFTVLESDISTLTFQIGQLSDISLTVLDSVTEAVYDEEFTDLSGVASSTDVVSDGAALTLVVVKHISIQSLPRHYMSGKQSR